jgi:hypothetical protein
MLLRRKAALPVLGGTVVFSIVMLVIPLRARLDVSLGTGSTRRTEFSCGRVASLTHYTRAQALLMLGGEVALGAQHAVNDQCSHKRTRRLLYTAVVALGGVLLAAGLLVSRSRVVRLVGAGGGGLVLAVGLLSFRNQG